MSERALLMAIRDQLEAEISHLEKILPSEGETFDSPKIGAAYDLSRTRPYVRLFWDRPERLETIIGWQDWPQLVGLKRLLSRVNSYIGAA